MAGLNPYGALYASEPKGPGDARPTALRVLEDNNALGAWQGRVVLVTGGTSGIGTTTAQALHATGADVYFTARDMAKGEQTAETIRKQSPGKGKIEPILMNMESLESVKQAARSLLSLTGNKLNVLINNAGKCQVPMQLLRQQIATDQR